MLETLYTFNSLTAEVKALKFRIKDFLGGDRNPSIKKTNAETKFSYALWTSVSFPLAKLTNTLLELKRITQVRLTSLVSIYYGEEVVAEQKEALSITAFTVEGEDKLVSSLYASANYQKGLEYELGLSYAIIFDRIF